MWLRSEIVRAFKGGIIPQMFAYQVSSATTIIVLLSRPDPSLHHTHAHTHTHTHTLSLSLYLYLYLLATNLLNSPVSHSLSAQPED